MSAWMIWCVAAGILVALEMFSGTFYLLMVAIGLVAGAAAALAGLAFEFQLLSAAAVGIAATWALRRSRWGRRAKPDSGRNPDINLDIGQTLTVTAWHADGRTARAQYRGAAWDVELDAGSQPVSGQFIIREIRGNRLVVANMR